LSFLALETWFISLQRQLSIRQHRNLIILDGELSWSQSCVESVIAVFQNNENLKGSAKICIWGNDFSIPQKIKDKDSPIREVQNYRHHLGTENDLLIYADADFHPDAFAALSGTIAAGGLFVWICPPYLTNNLDNLFLQRIWQKAKQNNDVYVLSADQQHLPELSSEPLLKEGELARAQLRDDCRTLEQQQAVVAIDKVATGHRKRPLVLTADRGRGKSSALAIAVANRLRDKSVVEGQKIIVSAPHIDALGVFFNQLQVSCPEGKYHQCTFSFNNHRVEFIAVDVLLSEKPTASLLLIDEAAAIPVYILSQMLDSYHRVVFSSTQHGYEGAGRGFAVKFKQILREKTPDFKKLHLHQPIRWALNDPLEAFVFDAFLFNGIDECNYVSSVVGGETSTTALTFSQINQQQLIENESLLQQVFAVLVTAHYQTTPSDLKLLINNCSVRLFIVSSSERVVAVALTLLEGKVSGQEVVDVAQAKRRLKNQFLPQSLFLHNHCQQAFDYQYLRIMRIAVLPSFQQLGIGSQLLTNIYQYGQQNNIDMLGTSFGANESLLRFWFAAGYHILRLGFTTDKASGEYSALCLLPLSKQGKVLVDQRQSQFYRTFLYLLTEQYQRVSSVVVKEVIRQWPKKLLPILTQEDLKVTDDYVQKKSLFDACIYSLHLQLVHQLALMPAILSINDTSPNILSNAKLIELLIKRILQKHPVEQLCQQFGLTGKKQLNQVLIEGVKQCFKNDKQK